MRLLKFGTAVAVALSVMSAAHAADVAPAPVFTKAPAVVPGYPYNAAGFYYGAGAMSMADSVSTANTGVVGLGAGFDFAVGYQGRGGLDFIAYDLTATYQNIGASGLCGTNGTPCSSTSKIEIEPGIKLGFPWQTLQAAAPNWNALFPGLPTLNVQQTPGSVPHPYLYVGLPIRSVSASYGPAASKDIWIAQAALGIGMQNPIQANAIADCRAEVLLSGAGIGITGAAPKSLFSMGAQSRCHILF